MENKKKGIYQVHRVHLDIREKQAKEDVQTKLNSILLELQQNNNVAIIDVTEQVVDKSNVYVLIKYIDYSLED